MITIKKRVVESWWL